MLENVSDDQVKGAYDQYIQHARFIHPSGQSYSQLFR